MNRILISIILILCLLTAVDLYSIYRLRLFDKHPCIDYSMVYSEPTVKVNIDKRNALVEQKKSVEAVSYYTKAIETNPNYAVTYFLRGDSDVKSNNFILELKKTKDIKLREELH